MNIYELTIPIENIPKIGGSKISGPQDPRQSHHLPQLVLGTQEIGR